MAMEGVVSPDIFAGAVETAVERIMPEDVLQMPEARRILEAKLRGIRNMDGKLSLGDMESRVEGVLQSIHWAVSRMGHREGGGVIVSAVEYAADLCMELECLFHGLLNMPRGLQMALDFRCTQILREGKNMHHSSLKAEIEAFLIDDAARANVILATLGFGEAEGVAAVDEGFGKTFH